MKLLTERDAELLNDTVSLMYHVKGLEKGLVKLSEELGGWQPKKTYILLHHSFTDDGSTLSWPAIRENHITKRGFTDIGYQFGIELYKENYEILTGRLILDKGAHCPQHKMNEKSIGICFIGNFDLAPPSPTLFNLGINFVSSLCLYGGLSPENIRGHRDFNSSKSCPGTEFDVDKFREAVREKCKRLT